MINSRSKRRVKPYLQTLTLGLLATIGLSAHSQDPPASDDSVEPPAAKVASFYSGDDIQLLAKRLPSDQVTWLTVNQKPVLALFNTEKTGNALGGVILIPSHEQSLGSFTLLNNLQQTLVKNRWHALTLSMPTVDDNALRTAFFNVAPQKPAPPIADENATEQLPEEDQAAVAAIPTTAIEDSLTPPDYEVLAQQTIDAGVRFFNDKGIYNMVILGEGSGGARAVEYLSKLAGLQQLKQVRGIALLNSVNQTTPHHVNITTLIATLKHPVLDLYFANNDLYRREALKRKQAGLALPKGQYQSVTLPYFRPGRQREEDRLSKRVRGWLDRTAAGVSVEKR